MGHAGPAELVLQVDDCGDSSADGILLGVGYVGEEHEAHKGEEGGRGDDLAEFSRLVEGKGAAEETSASTERRTLDLCLI